LQDFLFSPERARTLVRFLSGGERNRVLLAKLFAKPANLIVLDEPTNDLDAETLELLEERLVQFEGTVLMVSHDRTFLNNVVTSTIVYEDGGVREYVGGYDDWIRQREARLANAKAEAATAAKASRAGERSSAKNASKSGESEARKRRLTFKERQERESLPKKIEQLDADIAALHAEMIQPEYYKKPGDQIAAQAARLKELESQLVATYQRWEALMELDV
jgi:ATP-binding cassette subfamily F protein uup